MIIANSQLSLASQYGMSISQTASESINLTVTQASQNPSDSTIVDLSPEALAAQKGAGLDLAAMLEANPLWNIVRQIVKAVTGKDLQVSDLLGGGKVITASNAQTNAPSTTDTPPSTPAPPTWALRIDQSVSMTTTEQATFSAQGSVTTVDGRTIDLSASVALQQQETITQSSTLTAGNAPHAKDPLVLNYGRASAALSDQKFLFDLESNGSKVSISMPAAGSGFLVLDKNGNNKVDNGSELFGVNSGNGFADLAQYDVSHKGWIDASDPVWKSLKLWIKDAAGNDQLLSLDQLGIGAIDLQNANTPFTLKDSQGNVNGDISRTGVFLTESGNVGTVQQVDLTV